MHVRKLKWDSAGGVFVPVKQRAAFGRYLKGPVPLPWLQAALVLPGKAVNVGLAVWFKAGAQKSRADIPVSNELVKPFGVDRYAKSRALAQLEGAGLVKVRQVGKAAPRVTLLKTSTRLTRAVRP